MGFTFGPLDRDGAGLVPKLLGADVELANSVLGLRDPQGTGRIASRLLLGRIAGVPQYASSGGWSGGWSSSTPVSTGSQGAVGLRASCPARPLHAQHTPSSPGAGAAYRADGALHAQAGQYTAAADVPYAAAADGGADSGSYSTAYYNLQDWGRKFLPTNGGCCYIDLWHLEVCIPEVLSAFDYLAAFHAMLLVARQAMNAVNAELGPGRRVRVLANNSDGLDNSYGGHLNCLVARRTWDEIFYQFRPTSLGYLASFQVSSLVFAGQGKVGAENGRPWVPYQLSQRADFFETVVGLPTTINRPLVNSRDEPLCGTWHARANAAGCRPDYARLHCIFYDTNLCHGANVLKAGTMQMVLAMLEAGWGDSRLVLDRPLEALIQLSHDPTLKSKLRMADGRRLTGVELQLCFLEQMQAFHQQGGFAGVVPRAGEILELYADTLEKLRAGELDALAGRLDWVLKLRLLQRAQTQQPNLRWNSAQMKLLDHLYSSLDPHEGLYWIAERSGRVERLVPPSQVEWFVHQPPQDTRAFARAMLLRTVGPEALSRVDWDSISFRLKGRRNWWTYRTLDMFDPLGLTRAQTGHLFAARLPLDELLDALAGVDSAVQMEAEPVATAEVDWVAQREAEPAAPLEDAGAGKAEDAVAGRAHREQPRAATGSLGDQCGAGHAAGQPNAGKSPLLLPPPERPPRGDPPDGSSRGLSLGSKDGSSLDSRDTWMGSSKDGSAGTSLGSSSLTSLGTSSGTSAGISGGASTGDLQADSSADRAGEAASPAGHAAGGQETAFFQPQLSKGGAGYGPAATTRPDTASGRRPSRQ